MVTLIVSVGLISFAMYKISVAPEYVIDATRKVTTEGLSAKKFWTDNKLMFLIPTAANVLSMILAAVLLVTG